MECGETLLQYDGARVSRQTSDETDTQRDDHVIINTEIEVMQEQTKEYKSFPENHQKLERGEKRFPFRFQRDPGAGPVDALTLDF